MGPKNLPYSQFPLVLMLSFTQLPLQPDSWLKPHPLINELSIVMALSQRPPVNIANEVSLSEMEGPQAQKTAF